jgi:hypothetical protein
MPMKAATLLWRLEERGLAMTASLTNDWFITDRGRRVLAGTDEPLPKRVRPTDVVREPKSRKDPR